MLKAYYDAQIQTRSLQLHKDDKQDVEVDKIESIMRNEFEKMNAKLDKIISR